MLRCCPVIALRVGPIAVQHHFHKPMLEQKLLQRLRSPFDKAPLQCGAQIQDPASSGAETTHLSRGALCTAVAHASSGREERAERSARRRGTGG